MFTIIKEFHFEASHRLDGLPESHICSRLHGHSYKIIVELKSEELNDVLFVQDYRELDSIKRFIDEHYDHRHLNDVIAGNPTAERIAEHFFNTFSSSYPKLVAVTVKETDKTSARYQP